MIYEFIRDGMLPEIHKGLIMLKNEQTSVMLYILKLDLRLISNSQENLANLILLISPTYYCVL